MTYGNDNDDADDDDYDDDNNEGDDDDSDDDDDDVMTMTTMMMTNLTVRMNGLICENLETSGSTVIRIICVNNLSNQHQLYSQLVL